MIERQPCVPVGVERLPDGLVEIHFNVDSDIVWRTEQPETHAQRAYDQAVALAGLYARHAALVEAARVAVTVWDGDDWVPCWAMYELDAVLREELGDGDA